MAAAVKTDHPHVVQVEGVCGGAPVIDGLRVAVHHVVTLHQRGESILDIADTLNITEAQVFHALSYFFDHRDEIMALIGHEDRSIGNGEESLCWQYLVARPHRWRRQLSVKGRNMTVGQLVSTMRVNRYTPQQASEELELPLAAIEEALAYYTEHRDLIELEANEERRRMSERGLPLEPKDLSR